MAVTTQTARAQPKSPAAHRADMPEPFHTFRCAIRKQVRASGCKLVQAKFGNEDMPCGFHGLFLFSHVWPCQQSSGANRCSWKPTRPQEGAVMEGEQSEQRGAGAGWSAATDTGPNGP